MTDKIKASVLPTDIHQRSKHLRHLYPDMGLKLQVLKFFLEIKITAVRQVRISLHPLRSEPEDIVCENATWHAKMAVALVLHLFLCAWSAKTKDPKLIPMDDNTNTWVA